MTWFSLLSEAQLRAVVAQLAANIDRDYADVGLVLVCVLKGAAVFTADLMRQLQADLLRVEYIRGSSYGSGTESSGAVSIEGTPLAANITGRHVLLVDDISDTGHTLVAVSDHLREMNPACRCVCAPCWTNRSGGKSTSPTITWGSPSPTTS